MECENFIFYKKREFVFRKRMTTDYLISDVNIVNVTPRVPTKDLVALQCNLFTVRPLGTHMFVWMDVSVCSHKPT